MAQIVRFLPFREIFAFLGVRFIAVNDNYDSLAGKTASDDLIIPLKNLINEVYSKDISKKSGSALATKQKNGDFIGAWAPYGYRKCADNPHRLEPDEATAPIVRQIFQWRSDGMSVTQIARKLNDSITSSPSAYLYNTGICKTEKYNGAIWYIQAVKNILSRQVYIGHMVQGTKRQSFYENRSQYKNSLPMMITVLIVTVIGSFVASFLPEKAMGSTMQIALIIIGLRFILKPVTTTKEQMNAGSPQKRLIKSIVGGVFVGFICGFVGAGGGMMMLFVLTSFLGYQMHMAVGTSVFIMAFTALVGGISHFAIGGMPDIMAMVLCAAFTLLWARIAAIIANKSDAKTLNRTVGVVMILTSIVILIVNGIR